MELKIDYSVLPKSYENIILLQSKDMTFIRSNISNMDDINEWVKIFQHNTNTQWLVRLSAPDKTRFVCGKRFVCQHSSYRNMGVQKRNRNRLKNANCCAWIYVVVKLSTIHTKRKDQFIRSGLCGLIKINNIHSHNLHDVEMFKYLQPSDELRYQFFGYFDLGMGITEACEFHKSLLKRTERNEQQVFRNGRTSPLYRTVRYWHDLWKNTNNNASHMTDDDEWTTEIIEVVFPETNESLVNTSPDDSLLMHTSDDDTSTSNARTKILLDAALDVSNDSNAEVGKILLNNSDDHHVTEEILDENDVLGTNVATALKRMNNLQNIRAKKLIVKILSDGLSNKLKQADVLLCGVSNDSLF